jgi:hypothetical protein
VVSEPFWFVGDHDFLLAVFTSSLFSFNFFFLFSSSSFSFHSIVYIH